MGRSTSRSLLGAIGAVALAASAPCGATGCSHPWDDYEWQPGADGGSGGGASQACIAVCGAYELCSGTAWPDCSTECASCNSAELTIIGACVDALSGDCPNDVIAFRACVNASVQCMDVP